MTCIAIGIILSVTKKEEEIALDLDDKRKRDDALQQIIDAQVALNEEKEVDENQQKMEENMLKKLEEVKRKVENVTHLKRRVLECCVAILGQLNPLNQI